MSIKNPEGSKALRREKKPGTFLRGLRGKVLTKDAGLLKLRGIGASKEPGGYSWRKHEIADCGQKSHPLSE